MSLHPAWTLEGLERACRRALEERAGVRIASLDKLHADVEWEIGKRIKIRVDTYKCGLIAGAVHELLHVVLEDDLRPFAESLAEEYILVTEKRLAEKILASPARTDWWRRALRRLTQ